MSDRYRILGVPIDAVDIPRASARIIDWAGDTQGRFVCIRDVHGLLHAVDDPALMAIHQRASMVTPDGMPIAMIGRWRGHDVSQTCGADLMEATLEAGLEHGVRHFFYGGNEGVADALARKLEARFPGLQVAGTLCPPFRPLTADERTIDLQRIRDSDADVVWVGISTPKQERLMDDFARELPCTLLGVGAAFDFHLGSVKRAPKWIRRLMLEWAYRVASEPRRLARRYFVAVPRFIMLVGAESARGLLARRPA